MGNGKEGIENKGRSKVSRGERINKRKRKKKKRIKRIIISLVTILAMFIIGGSLYIYSFLSGLKTNNLGTGKAALSSTSPINILVLGMDIGDTDNQGNKLGRRSDTIMVLNYNPNSKNVNLVSVPRDTLIEVDAYLDTGEYQRYWKMNAAYVLGGEEEVTKQVEELLSIELNYIIEIDYNAFRSIIDALGGVEMYIEQDMFYDDDEQNLHIDFKAGETVKLDGKKAEEFFRWRENNDGSGLANGDLDRIKNQQLFIKKVVEKALKPSIILKVPKILKAISENIETNIPAKELISLGIKIMKLNPSDIIMNTLQGEAEYIFGQSYLIPDEDLNRDLINALSVKDSSLTPNLDSMDKTKLKILVLNGTQINGLASSAREKLNSLGYENVEVDNTSGLDKSIIQTNNKALKEIIKNEIGIEKVRKISEDVYKQYDAVIILGADYNLLD